MLIGSPTIFFFQAEDGIRDHCVTGVQTCAFPIYRRLALHPAVRSRLWRQREFGTVQRDGERDGDREDGGVRSTKRIRARRDNFQVEGLGHFEIGRASCREKGEVWV